MFTNRLGVNSEGLPAQTSTADYVVISSTSGASVYSDGQTPRERSVDKTYRPKPLATLEPVVGSDERLRALPPPSSVTPEEQAFLQEVALFASRTGGFVSCC